MQYLNVQLSIPVPAESIIISKAELEELKKSELSGVYWSMKDIEKRINKKSEWIKEHILYPARFREILDCEKGGFVYYPKVQGQTWSFQASKMAKSLDNNFNEIFSAKNVI